MILIVSVAFLAVGFLLGFVSYAYMDMRKVCGKPHEEIPNADGS